MSIKDNTPLGGAPSLGRALASIKQHDCPRCTLWSECLCSPRMTQLQGQRVISALLKHGDPGVALRPGTRAVLVWQRSYRPGVSAPVTYLSQKAQDNMRGVPPLVHEYEAYAYNDAFEFVRIRVTSDMIEDVHVPTSE